jgi:predicted phosphodiesterase
LKIAALYDIHANLPALEAVLEELRSLAVDEVVVGGDVLPGPMPRETLECLQAIQIPARFIYGNGEVAVLDELADRKPRVPDQFRPAIRWNAEQLDFRSRDWVASWPATLRIGVPGIGPVLFCHATPRNENDIFTGFTPENKLLSFFQGLDVSVVVCGHTHMQFDRMIGSVRVVNAGSVGMPFGPVGADWLLISDSMEFRHTEYDFNAAAERVRATNYPGAEDFATKNILHPPSGQQMLEVFSRVEIA